MRIADSSIQEVNDKLDAVAVVGEHLRLEKRSGRYWGCCPFHNEKTPSFTVDPERKLYYCFGCHKGGTIIDFVMEMEKTSFPETIELLAKKSAVALVYEGQTGDQAEAGRIAASQKKDELFELYRRVAVSFNHLLLEKPEGRDAKGYILDRGISNEMIDKFRLGYAPADRSWLFNFLTAKGYSQEFLAASGLFSAKYPRTAFFANRLMFPIADRQGRTVAFGARLLAGGANSGAGPSTGGGNPGVDTPSAGPKYLNSLESAIYKKGQTLFAIDLALPEIRRTGAVYIAEGYLDVIALHQAGIANAAAPLGTAFTDDQAKLIKRWANQVYLLFDSDDAGQNAAVKGILTCRRNGLACAVVVPGQATKDTADILRNFGTEAAPPKDPADILRNFGTEALQNSAKCFINDFEYLVNRARALFDMASSGGKAKAVAFLFPYITALDSEVSKDTCIDDIADAFGVERQAVQSDFHHFGQAEEPRRITNPKEVPLPQVKPVRMNDELFLLTAVAVNHRLFTKLRSTLSVEELEDPQAKELFFALEEWFRNGVPEESADASVPGDAVLPYDLLSRIHDEALRNFVIEQGASRAFFQDPDQLVRESVQRVKQKRLERRQAEIIIELRTQKRGEGGLGLSDLLAEKVHVDAELLRLKDANE
ncbi:DNA primase [Spirochaetia bacterium]|nr:DNA primase [Spirochaetia bacterium]